MSVLHSSTRREFLKSAAAPVAAAAMTAASYARAPGANERIRIAQIGCGNRGFGAHMAGVHRYIDLVHFITGARFPHSAAAMGDTFVWKDRRQFDCPEQVETSLIYPEGFMVHFCANLCNAYGGRTVAYGTQGILDFDKAKASGAGAYKQGLMREEVAVEPVDCPDHFLNWLQCLRTRRAPAAPIEAGYQHAVACILSDRAWETGRRQVYDHQKREIREG